MRILRCVAILSIALPCFAAESDALAISANIQARHLPFGIVVDPMYASSASSDIIGYTRCGDSALWTGHYLAAESFRYGVTRSPEALTAVKQAIAGLSGLVEVTGANLLARCRLPLASPFTAGIQREEAANGVFTNSALNASWIGNTSRDQYMGVIFGLSVAYDVVDAADVRASVSALVTRMVEFLVANNWAIRLPEGSSPNTFLIRPDELLAVLKVAAHVNPSRFSDNYAAQQRSLSAAVSTVIAFDTLTDSSYFKFNLGAITLYTLIRLEESATQETYRRAYSIFRAHVESHQNAFFNAIDRAVNGPDTGRDIESSVLLDLWLKWPRRDPFVDRSSSVGVCGSQACRPIPVDLRVPTDFIWQRNPFQLSGGGSSTIETAGVDYILPYWMMRYLSIPRATSVQSSAAPLPVAADGIASLFGDNLVSEVRVKDSAGVERPATIFYSSPTQVNFLVPAASATGRADFTSGTATISATIQRVAPALFTMTGTGTGVAAATAVRVGADGRQTPVAVFICATACTPTPIDLDGQVYLALYGTGLRNRSNQLNVTVTVDTIPVPVLFAGAQSTFPGLDQINIALSPLLRGAGEVSVVATVDGQRSNTVRISIR